MDFKTIASIMGLSSLISVFFNIIFGHFEKKRMMMFEKNMIEKESRYTATLAYMLVALDADNIHFVELSQPLLGQVVNKNKTDVEQFFLEELRARYVFSHLYASDNVLKAMDGFMQNPTEKNYKAAAVAMRKDLWH